MNKKVLELINEQIWTENHSSFFYLNLAKEFASRGLAEYPHFSLINQKKKGLTC